MNRREAGELLADVCMELARAPVDIESILVLATSRLSRLKPGTWVAVVMNPDPATSRIVVADDRDREMARWVDDYVAAIDRPRRAPTAGLSQRVIESGTSIAVANMSYDEFVLLLSPAGQARCRTAPPPGSVTSVSFVIVPMRVGGATLGTLGMTDARGRHAIDESDVEWMQLVADRIALSVDHARLAGNTVVHAAELDMVRTIATANPHAADVRVTLSAIVERATTLPDVDAADIMLLTDDEKELTVAVSAGHRSPWPPEPRVDARWVTLDRPSLELNSGHPRRAQLMREGFQTFGSIPIRSPAGTFGILNLYSRAQVDWDENRLEFFDSLARLVALVLDTPPARRAVAGRATQRPSFSDLEIRILRLVAEGLTNREIAGQIYRSENTVKFHVRRILERTETANRTELVRRALDEGWL